MDNQKSHNALNGMAIERAASFILSALNAVNAIDNEPQCQGKIDELAANLWKCRDHALLISKQIGGRP